MVWSKFMTQTRQFPS